MRRGIAGAGDELASFDHDGRTFWHAPGEAPASASPAGHLLQVLDEMYRGYQDSRWVVDADAIVPRGRESAIGMALVEGQLVASMKRTVGAKAVTFEIRPHRALPKREIAAIQDAATRYAEYLELEARVNFEVVPD